MAERTASNGVTDKVEVFRPANNSFTVLGQLSSAHADYAITVIDQHRTLIAGGSDGSSTLNTLDIFDSWTNAVTPAGTMKTGRRNLGAATLLEPARYCSPAAMTKTAPLAST